MFINWALQEINLKIVYYGPGMSGKTTNLEYIHSKLDSSLKGDLVSLKTKEDRTIFFDFMQIEVGRIKGKKPKFNLYTVPGQVYYASSRKVILNGVDGIVFVADSMMVRREKNILSIKNLQEDLANYRKSIFKMPIVLQYNKVDLVEQGIPLTSVEMLQKDLNSQLKTSSFKASALKGTNVVPTMKKIISMTIGSIVKELK